MDFIIFDRFNDVMYGMYDFDIVIKILELHLFNYIVKNYDHVYQIDLNYYEDEPFYNGSTINNNEIDLYINILKPNIDTNIDINLTKYIFYMDTTHTEPDIIPFTNADDVADFVLNYYYNGNLHIEVRNNELYLIFNEIEEVDMLFDSNIVDRPRTINEFKKYIIDGNEWEIYGYGRSHGVAPWAKLYKINDYLAAK